jgi:hypothetical protein
MLGCTTSSNGSVLHVGASGNFPPTEYRTKEFGELEKARRRSFLGEAMYQYDEMVQLKINAMDENPLEGLSQEGHSIRAQMLGQFFDAD